MFPDHIRDGLKHVFLDGVIHVFPDHLPDGVRHVFPETLPPRCEVDEDLQTLKDERDSDSVSGVFFLPDRR